MDEFSRKDLIKELGKDDLSSCFAVTIHSNIEEMLSGEVPSYVTTVYTLGPDGMDEESKRVISDALFKIADEVKAVLKTG